MLNLINHSQIFSYKQTCHTVRTTIHNSTQHIATQRNTTQPNTIQYNTIQYNTMQYNSIQYNTIFFCFQGFPLNRYVLAMLEMKAGKTNEERPLCTQHKQPLTLFCDAIKCQQVKYKDFFVVVSQQQHNYTKAFANKIAIHEFAIQTPPLF